MRALPSPLAVCLSAGLAAALPCQTVHQVGVFGFSTINAAIAAASPGDIVLVDPGTHAPFVLDKALTIRGTPGFSTNVITFGSVRSARAAGANGRSGPTGGNVVWAAESAAHATINKAARTFLIVRSPGRWPTVWRPAGCRSTCDCSAPAISPPRL